MAVAAALVAADVGALAVGDGDDVQGVVSERDVVAGAGRPTWCSETTAGDIAHTRLVWCDVQPTSPRSPRR